MQGLSNQKRVKAVRRAYTLRGVVLGEEHLALAGLDFPIVLAESYITELNSTTTTTEINYRSNGQRSLSNVLQALRHERRDVRMQAALALGKFGDIRAIPHLLDACVDDPEWIVREAALQGIGEMAPSIRDLRSLPGLLMALNDRAWTVRRAGVWVLGMLLDRRAIPHLLSMLEDSNSLIREAAVWALGELGDSSVNPQLLELLGDRSEGVRLAVLRILGKIGDSQTVTALMFTLSDAGELAAAVVETLGEIGDPVALPIIVTMLSDHREQVRCSAAVALGKLGDPAAMLSLLNMLHHTELAMRIAAAEGIGLLGESITVLEVQTSAYQALLLIWSDNRSDPKLHHVIGEAMGRIHHAVEDTTVLYRQTGY